MLVQDLVQATLQQQAMDVDKMLASFHVDTKGKAGA